jgi:hypothetical protein
VLNRHPNPVPDVCDVCRYAVDHNTDAETEHALTRLATLVLSEGLSGVGGGPAALPGLVVFSFPPIDRGPVHRFEPRHYFWAMFHELDIQLVLRQEVAS